MNKSLYYLADFLFIHWRSIHMSRKTQTSTLLSSSHSPALVIQHAEMEDKRVQPGSLRFVLTRIKIPSAVSVCRINRGARKGQREGISTGRQFTGLCPSLL